jgi:hypothetical protein
MVQPEFVEAMLRAEGVSMEEGETGDNWVDYWSWRDQEDNEEDEEVWD